VDLITARLLTAAETASNHKKRVIRKQNQPSMANSKISALPSATTPLAGTEVLPVVQGGITEQVSVANLTAGRDVSASGLFVDANSATSAIRITQLGAGDVLTVEDSASPDATPFVINANGVVVSGSTTAVNYGGFTPNIQVNAAGAAQIGLSRFSANATSNVIAILKSRGATVGDFTVVASGDALGRLEFYGADGTTGIIAARIQGEVDGTPGTSDMPGRLTFSTTADGASTPSERLRIDSAGNILNRSIGGLGYGTGSGGAVTQLTSRTTGVALNKTNGAITMFTAAGSAIAATFTVTNSTVAATDTIILNQKSGTNLYVFLVTAVAAGSFNITFYTTGGIASDAPVINFSVIKAVTA
jgi:hypothetical protein